MPERLSGLVILVVDDNARVQAIWQAILSAAGARWIGALTAGEARSVLVAQPVDLVVVDEHLEQGPGANGATLIAWIRQHQDSAICDLPVLACTSDRSRQNRRRLLSAGASLISFKPLIPGKILPALARLAPGSSQPLQ